MTTRHWTPSVRHRLTAFLVACVVQPSSAAAAPPQGPGPVAKPAAPADVVTGTPGCVAFWDFVKR